MPRESSRAAFEKLVETFASEPAVSRKSGRFTRDATSLNIDGKIFAMLVRDQFIVKLPRSRAIELIESAVAVPYVLGNRAMKEWIVVKPSANARWPSLAREAREFVEGARAKRPVAGAEGAALRRLRKHPR